jgi:hypothetical protein
MRNIAVSDATERAPTTRTPRTHPFAYACIHRHTQAHIRTPTQARIRMHVHAYTVAQAKARRVAAEADKRRKAGMRAIDERLRRSRCWCTCNSRLEHAQTCNIMGVSREDLFWYYATGGRIGAAANGHGTQTEYGSHARGSSFRASIFQPRRRNQSGSRISSIV